ncbi:MAG: hypothetical protein KAJ75_06715 [Alphaproteobacteria bacterium]|nr:hypothetical protein [Alphaproteobacteria bacterium]
MEWQAIKDERFKSLLEAVNSLHHRKFFDEKTSRLFCKDLPFFENYQLLKATEYSAHPPLSMRFLFNGSDVIKLNGTKKPILDVCKKDSLSITKNNIISYVKFFLDNVTAKEGSFQIIESIDDITFFENTTPKEKTAINKNILPIEILSVKEKAFKITASLLYSKCLYHATLKINKNGTVNIAKEKPVLTNLPVRKIMLR